MTEQQTDLQERELDYWMTRAYEAEGKLWKAEAEQDYRRRENEELAIALNLALTGEEVQTGERYSNAVALSQAVLRADRAEARIRHLEATAQVLMKEVLDAENARDESRRGKVEAEARIKAVEDVLELHGPAHDEPGQDEADCGPQIIADIRRALEG